MNLHASSVAALAAVYMAALGRFTARDALTGVVFALVFLWWGRRHVPGRAPGRRGAARRAMALPALAWAVVVESFRGAAAVWLASVAPHRSARAGFVDVPIGERTRHGVSASAFVFSLSPGSVLVDVDERRRVMVFHYMDAGDPESIRRAHARFYRERQAPVAP